MIMVGLLCVCIVLFQEFGPIGKFSLVLGLLVIFAHVAGNALGTQLRDSGDRPIQESEFDSAEQTARQSAPVAARPDQFARATNLSSSQGFGRAVYGWIGGGAIIAALIAGGLLFTFGGSTTSVASILLGSMSASVIGGMVGFGTFSFVRVTFGALSEAQEDASPMEQRSLLARLAERLMGVPNETKSSNEDVD